nr:ribonuclease H-like domain-containing protein [Tanacetum cinerariifolium]
MDSLSPQVVSSAKLPILNPNELDLWKMRIEQYFLMTDYSLWEVILNGDSPVPTCLVEGLPRTQEGLLLLSPREGMFQLRPQLQMHWSLSVMVQELMIRVINPRRNLQTLHSWLSHPLPPIYLLTV